MDIVALLRVMRPWSRALLKDIGVQLQLCTFLLQDEALVSQVKPKNRSQQQLSLDLPGASMLGLVDYEDSDDEQQKEGQAQPRQQGSLSSPLGHPTEPAAQRDPLATAHPAGTALPSAAELLSGAPAATLVSAAPAQQSLTGGKRSTPASKIGALPNPLAPQSKVARSVGAASVAGGKPPQGVLLPPQLRGRANVATEDLSSMFTRDSHKRLQGNKGS